MGVSESGGNIINEGDVYGTYIHGIFDKGGNCRRNRSVADEEKETGSFRCKAFDIEEYKQSQYDLLVRGLREALNVDLLYRIINGRRIVKSKRRNGDRRI